MIRFYVKGDPAAPGFKIRGAHAEAYRQRLTSALRAAAPDVCGLSSDVRVTADFYCSDYHRRDLDNLIKTTFDALTSAGLWLDDRQVHEVRARVFRGHAEPGAEISIEEIADPSPRLRLCPQCGRPALYRKRHCSRECRVAAARTTLVCKACGREMLLAKSTARLRSTCSRECRWSLARAAR